MLESAAGDAIRIAGGSRGALTPDEAIAGEGFTMLEAGLVGPVVGVPGLEALAPFPRVPAPLRQPLPEPWLERAQQEEARPSAEELQTVEPYYSGQEMPLPSVGGGIVGMAATIPLTPSSDVLIPAGSSQVVSDFLDISGSVNVEIGAGGVLEIG